MRKWFVVALVLFLVCSWMWDVSNIADRNGGGALTNGIWTVYDMGLVMHLFWYLAILLGLIFWFKWVSSEAESKRLRYLLLKREIGGGLNG